MPKRMLIDASHPEETRVVVLDGQRVDEFDFEAASRRPLKGNIYLAKVTRVEPSLQAAFVEYGGNRQGFLAFSEIHPDYYQIPVADRQALLAEQQEEARRGGDDEFESVETGIAVASEMELEVEEIGETESDSDVSDEEAEAPVSENGLDDDVSHSNGDDEGLSDRSAAERLAEADLDLPETAPSDGETDVAALRSDTERSSSSADQPVADSAAPGEENSAPHGETQAQPLRSQRSQRWVRKRHYRIQEVIKRKQIMLVQVVKEERGTKGAALTTFLSLAGRYCVLMPNTPRGGGISRKITNAVDRNRLKAAAATLELPEGMGLIIRTAGANRTKLEIKRDYEYLLRLWDQIRELTLQSNAPACVYEEGDIIKRAIRDLYNKDLSEIFVEGEEGYKNAKDFMRMLMPSHAKNVKLYRDTIPVFQKYHIEAQLDAMFQPTVTLKSGGYIVINQTEALVSIDVNSGRATREHSIEETAHKTNLEAADEIGRQLRLRDLAGLIVIDFIDMEDPRNDRDVEKRVRDAVKNDRARVQIGKISQFGLLEMSRQRLRAGVVAGSTIPCPHCGGQGIVRSVESTALRLLRALDEEAQRGRAAAVKVRVANEVALYTLNQKRRELARLEADYDISIAFEPKEDLLAGNFDLERSGDRVPPERPLRNAVHADAAFAMPVDISETVEEDDSARNVETDSEQSPAASPQPPNDAQRLNGGNKRRRRRRRGRGGSHAHETGIVAGSDVGTSPPAAAEITTEATLIAQSADSGSGVDVPDRKGEAPEATSTSRRRRRRRKPRNASAVAMGRVAEARDGHDHGVDLVPSGANENAPPPFGEQVTLNAPSEPVWSLGSDRAEAASETAHKPVGQMYYRRENALERVSNEQAAPIPTGSYTASDAEDAEDISATSSRESADDSTTAEAKPQRRGWWQRTFKS